MRFSPLETALKSGMLFPKDVSRQANDDAKLHDVSMTTATPAERLSRAPHTESTGSYVVDHKPWNVFCKTLDKQSKQQKSTSMEPFLHEACRYFWRLLVRCRSSRPRASLEFEWNSQLWDHTHVLRGSYSTWVGVSPRKVLSSRRTTGTDFT